MTKKKMAKPDRLIQTQHFKKRCKERRVNPDSFVRNCRLKRDTETGEITAIHRRNKAPVIIGDDNQLHLKTIKIDGKHETPDDRRKSFFGRKQKKFFK